MNSHFLTTDTSRLQQTTGYWSHEKILCNTTDQVVLLHQPDSDQLRNEAITLQDFVRNSKSFKAYFEKWVGKNYLGALSLDKVLNNNGGNWARFQKQLRAQKYNKARISRHMASLWWQVNQEDPHAAINKEMLHRIPGKLCPLIIDWSARITDDAEDFLSKIVKISQIEIHSGKQNHPNYSKLKPSDKIHVCVTSLSIEERQLVEWALPFLTTNSSVKQYYHATLCASHASAAFLAWLRCKQVLLLPYNFQHIEQWLHDLGAWPGRLLKSNEAKSAIKSGLFRFIASSTTSHIDDIPADLLLIYDVEPFRPAFYTHLAGWLKHPAVERKRTVFPIDHLQKANLIRKNHPEKNFPGWVREECNEDWYGFAQIWWQHTSGGNRKRNIFKRFLAWAWQKRAFETPWKIKPEDLRNYNYPADPRTYQTHLKNNQIEDKASCWSGSATMFRFVHQRALNSSCRIPFHGELNNPFATIDNPFTTRRNKKHKTHRRSIPANIHELMIDILYNQDDNGHPTFSWARETTMPMDMVIIPDPDNPRKQIKAWCPSRTTCLAVLLLSPFRAAQARWLDQGLMDESCYDFSTKRIIPNQHPLSEFIYPNGNTHLQQYGRASGVLQFSTDLIRDEETLCIFVNTNKTQLWDSQKISGFEVPWPDGSQLLASSDPSQRATGKWLSRLYRVLEYQMQWMRRHDPNPHPLSFFHSHEDRHRLADLSEVKNSIPWFVPLFRDLSLNKYVTDTLHDQPFRTSPPVSYAKIVRLYNQLAVEAERQFETRHNRKIFLTVPSKNGTGRKCKFDLHSLRVTWISRLYEMGIPIEIISELFAGHATMVMTIHYLKHEISFIREQLIEAAANQDYSGGMEALWERLQQGEQPDHFLTGPVFPEQISGFLPDDFVAIVPVEGGICPMGGRGSRCDEGGILELPDDAQGAKKKIRYGQVQGGCGNCRFFLTGPDFILDQLLSCNGLMLKMRALGKKVKELYLQLDAISRKLHYLPDNSGERQRMETEKMVLKGRIHSFEEQLSPLCVEWTNRHEMLLKSYELLKESVDSENKQLALVGNAKLTVEDLAVEDDRTTEFGLVRNIIEQARLVERQGYPLPEDAGIILRNFMDIILDQHDIKTLLLRIPDDKYATQAASVLAGWLSDEFGDEKVQDAIDRKSPLPLTMLQNEKLQQFADRLITNYRDKRPVLELFNEQDTEENTP